MFYSICISSRWEANCSHCFQYNISYLTDHSFQNKKDLSMFIWIPSQECSLMFANFSWATFCGWPVKELFQHQVQCSLPCFQVMPNKISILLIFKDLWWMYINLFSPKRKLSWKFGHICTKTLFPNGNISLLFYQQSPQQRTARILITGTIIENTGRTNQIRGFPIEHDECLLNVVWSKLFLSLVIMSSVHILRLLVSTSGSGISFGLYYWTEENGWSLWQYHRWSFPWTKGIVKKLHLIFFYWFLFCLTSAYTDAKVAKKKLTNLTRFSLFLFNTQMRVSFFWNSSKYLHVE